MIKGFAFFEVYVKLPVADGRLNWNDAIEVNGIKRDIIGCVDVAHFVRIRPIRSRILLLDICSQTGEEVHPTGKVACTIGRFTIIIRE